MTKRLNYSWVSHWCQQLCIIIITATLIPFMPLFASSAAISLCFYCLFSVSIWFLYLSSESSHLSPPISNLCSLVFTIFLHPQVSPYLLLSEFPFSSSFHIHPPIPVLYFYVAVSPPFFLLSYHSSPPPPQPPISSISFLSLFIPGWWNKQRAGFDVAPVPGPHGRSMCAWACSFPSLPWQALGVIMAEGGWSEQSHVCVIGLFPHKHTSHTSKSLEQDWRQNTDH